MFTFSEFSQGFATCAGIIGGLAVVAIMLSPEPPLYSLAVEKLDGQTYVLDHNLTASDCLEMRVDDQFCLTQPEGEI